MNKYIEIYNRFVNKINYIGSFTLFSMMCILTLDVALRKTRTGMSVNGSYELIEMGMVIVVFIGIASLQVKGRHLKVDMLINKIPKTSIKCFYMCLIVLVEVIVGLLLIIGSYNKIVSVINLGTYTDVLHIPIFPFVLIMMIGLILYTIALMIEARNWFTEALELRKEKIK